MRCWAREPRVGRASRTVVVLLFLLSFFAPTISVGAARPSAGAQGTEPTLDLAAMALTPDDLQAEGVEGAATASIFYVSSRYPTLGEVINQSVGGRAAEDTSKADRIAYEMDAAGWKRQYQAVMGEPTSPESTELNYGVYVDVAEYADAAGADAVLTLLTDGGRSDTLSGDPVGDRTEIRYDDKFGVGELILVAFRTENFLGSIELLLSEGLSVDLALALARRLEDRIERVRTATRLDMADVMLRLALPTRPAHFEGYLLIDRDLVEVMGDSDEERRLQAASFGEATDVFEVRQSIAPERGQMIPPLFRSRLHRFSDANAATDWMETVPDQVADESQSSEFEAVAVEDGQRLGDESLTYEYQIEVSQESLDGFRIYVRAGAIVARIDYQAVGQTPLAAVERLARAQVECLQEGACEGLGARPIGLGGQYCPSPPESSGPTINSSAIDGEERGVWLSGGDSGRTGTHPGPGPDGAPRVRWEIATIGAASSDPLVASGTVFVSTYEDESRRDLGNLFALEMASGEQRWCVTTGTAALPNPIIVGDLVVVGAGILPRTPAGYVLAEETPFVLALDWTSGLERWRFYHGGWASGLVAADGSIFVTTGQGSVWSIAANNGEVQWLYQANDSDSMGSPVVVDGTVYVSGGEFLHAVDTTTGAAKWQTGVDDAQFPSIRSVVDDTVYVTSSSSLHAIETSSGEERWRFDVESPRSVAVSDDVIYLGTGSTSSEDGTGSLYALDTETGRALWQFEADQAVAGSAIVGDVIYITTTAESDEEPVENEVIAIARAEGTEIWRIPFEGELTRPTVIGGLLFVGTENGLAGSVVAIEGDGNQ